MLGFQGTKGGVGGERRYIFQHQGNKKGSNPDVVAHTCHFLHWGCWDRGTTKLFTDWVVQ